MKYTTDCVVLDFYKIIGKKWTYPLLYSLKPNQEYSFEDFFKMSSRFINRTLLSNMLKEFITLSILEKQNKKYKLTSRGLQLKNKMTDIKKILSKSIVCKDTCIINKCFKG